MGREEVVEELGVGQSESRAETGESREKRMGWGWDGGAEGPADMQPFFWRELSLEGLTFHVGRGLSSSRSKSSWVCGKAREVKFGRDFIEFWLPEGSFLRAG